MPVYSNSLKYVSKLPSIYKYKFQPNKKVFVKQEQISKFFVGGGTDGGVVRLLKWEKECILPPFLL